MDNRTSKLPYMFWIIVAMALVIRLADSFFYNLHGEEISFVAIADTISFDNLPLHSLDHPVLNVYIVKASGFLFGNSPFGLRILHVLAGSATVALVFFIGRKVFSTQAGLWAAALLAVDQFHVGFSRAIFPEVLMLFFAAAAILQFLVYLERRNWRDGVVLGLLVALAYLSKEPGILLMPVFLFVLIVYPKQRARLRQPEVYYAISIVIAFFCLDVIGNTLQGYQASHLYRNTSLLQEGLQISLKPVALFLGEFVQWFNPTALDVDYYESNLYACNMYAGFFYLGSVVFALFHSVIRKNIGAMTLLVLFFFVFLFFMFLPGCEFWDPFWWASLCLLPAVVFGGWVLNGHWIESYSKVVRSFGFIFIATMVLLYIPRMTNQGPKTQMHTVEQIAAGRIRAGWERLDKGDLVLARRFFVYALNIGGEHPEAIEGIRQVDRALARNGLQERDDIMIDGGD